MRNLRQEHRHKHKSGHRHKNGHRHRGMGRGRERRRVFDAAELRLVLLHFINSEPHHGYDLIRAIEAKSGGSYAPSPGVVYPALSMLEDQGHIRAQQEKSGKKAFHITDNGKADLIEQDETISALLLRLESLAHEESRLNPAPAKRAMDSLKTALLNRMSREDANDNTALDIAEIIDAATQKIERL